MGRPVLRSQILLLADSESAKNKWFGALTELHRVIKKHQLPDKSVKRVVAHSCIAEQNIIVRSFVRITDLHCICQLLHFSSLLDQLNFAFVEKVIQRLYDIIKRLM